MTAGILSLCHLAAYAFPCDVKTYQAQDGLTAAVGDDNLAVTWAGAARGSQMRAVLALQDGAPMIREMAARGGDGDWTLILRDAMPYSHVDSGLRRITDQQLEPLKKLIDLMPSREDGRLKGL